MSEAARTYDRERLVDLVNGDAQRFINFGFVSAASAEYQTKAIENTALRVEIYDMSSLINAFGIQASEILTLPDPALAESPGVLEIREAGVIGPGRLSFFRGRYYVKLIYQDTSIDATEERLERDTREHLPALARRLANSIPGSSDLPPQLDALPQLKRVRRSERYYPEHLLELDDLGAGVSSLYGDPGPRFELGLPLDLDESRARQIFTELESSLTATNAVEDLGDQALRGSLANEKRLVIARRGDRLVIAMCEEERSPRSSTLHAVITEALTPPADREQQRDPRPWMREGRQSPPLKAPRDVEPRASHTEAP